MSDAIRPSRIGVTQRRQSIAKKRLSKDYFCVKSDLKPWGVIKVLDTDEVGRVVDDIQKIFCTIRSQ